MDTREEWKAIFDREIQSAQAARKSGNEGKARVCARRAAGAAAGEYLARRGSPWGHANAYINLQRLQNLPDVPLQIRHIAGHFLEKITEDHELPSEADLIQDALWLVDQLLKDSQGKGVE